MTKKTLIAKLKALEKEKPANTYYKALSLLMMYNPKMGGSLTEMSGSLTDSKLIMALLPHGFTLGNVAHGNQTKKLALASLKLRRSSFFVLSQALQTNKEVVLAAINLKEKTYTSSVHSVLSYLRSIKSPLLSDPDVVAAAMKTEDGKAFFEANQSPNLPIGLIFADPAKTKAIADIKGNYGAFFDLDPSLKLDKDVALAALENNYKATGGSCICVLHTLCYLKGSELLLRQPEIIEIIKKSNGGVAYLKTHGQSDLVKELFLPPAHQSQAPESVTIKVFKKDLPRLIEGCRGITLEIQT